MCYYYVSPQRPSHPTLHMTDVKSSCRQCDVILAEKTHENSFECSFNVGPFILGTLT